ncbi:MAG: agmatinase [Acetobacteraceae bacterium]|nr:agmatinase [Acetobacteraceae bacterium]
MPNPPPPAPRPAALTAAPATGHPTFLYSELVTELDALGAADIAFLGIPHGAGYSFREIVNDQSNMPAAMRRASDRIIRAPGRYDFDLGGPMYDNRPIRVVDCGDVAGELGDLGAHLRKAEAAVRRIRAAGAMPIVLGGDHGIPIPVLRALDKDGPITLVHVDQHLDWRDEVNGVTQGLSSPIRRASEMAHIGEIFQIGLHATGSARPEEVEAALAYGAHLFSAYDVHEHGMQKVLDRIPAGGRYYLTIDLDGIDPAIAPGVAAPCPGGLTFMQVRTLIHGLVAKGRVIGMDVVEITPQSDVNQVTCITAGRFIVNLIGAAVRAGYFDKARG